MIMSISESVRRLCHYFIMISPASTTKGAGVNIRNFALAIIMFAAGSLFTAALGSRSLHLSAKLPGPTVAAQTTPQQWEYRVVKAVGIG
jgi:hypothetical protein